MQPSILLSTGSRASHRVILPPTRKRMDEYKGCEQTHVVEHHQALSPSESKASHWQSAATAARFHRLCHPAAQRPLVDGLRWRWHNSAAAGIKQASTLRIGHPSPFSSLPKYRYINHGHDACSSASTTGGVTPYLPSVLHTPAPRERAQLGAHRPLSRGGRKDWCGPADRLRWAQQPCAPYASRRPLSVPDDDRASTVSECEWLSPALSLRSGRVTQLHCRRRTGRMGLLSPGVRRTCVPVYLETEACG